MAPPTSLVRAYAGAVVLVGIVALFFISKWWLDGAYFLGDIITFTAPLEQLFARYQARGQVPLWSPELGAGYPAAANGQVHFWYLPHLLLRAVLPGPVLVNVSLLLHVSLAAVGWYALARSYRLHGGAAMGGALLFVFGGAYSARFGLFNFVTALSWLPLILWLLHEWVTSGSRWALPALASAGTLLLYAGNPQAVGLVVLVALLYAGILLVASPWRWRTLLGLALSLLVAGFLAAPALLSVRELVPATDRATGLEREALLDISLPPAALVSLYRPHPFGHAAHYQGPKGEAELAVFVGAGALATAAAGVLAGRTHAIWRVLGLALCAIGTTIALGEYSSLATALLVRVPLNAFATPARYFFLAHVGITLLATVGLHQALLRWRWVGRAALALVVLPPAVFAWTFEAGQPWSALREPALVPALRSAGETVRLFAAADLSDDAPASNFGVTVGQHLAAGTTVTQTFTSPYERIAGVALRLSAPAAEAGGVVTALLTDAAGATVASAHVATRDSIDGELTPLVFPPTTVGTKPLTLQLSSNVAGRGAPRVYIHTNPGEHDFDPTGVLSDCAPTCVPVLAEARTADLSFAVLPASDLVPVRGHELLGPNVAAGYGVPSAQWTGALPLLPMQHYTTAMEQAQHQGDDAGWRHLLNRLGATHVASVFAPHRSLDQFPDMVPQAAVPVGPAFVRLFSNPQAYPRIHFATRVIAVADSDAQLQQLGELRAADVVADVARSREYRRGIIAAATASSRTVTITTTATEDTFLVLRDTYLPGWRVYVDGGATALYRVDSLFRGVEVPPGGHTVQFRYEPAWLLPSVYAVVLGATVLLGLTYYSGRHAAALSKR